MGGTSWGTGALEVWQHAHVTPDEANGIGGTEADPTDVEGAARIEYRGIDPFQVDRVPRHPIGHRLKPEHKARRVERIAVGRTLLDRADEEVGVRCVEDSSEGSDGLLGDFFRDLGCARRTAQFARQLGGGRSAD